MSEPVSWGRLQCPLPNSRYEQIQLGHGSGGKLSAELIESLIVPSFGTHLGPVLEDQATLRMPGSQAIDSPDTTGHGSRGARMAMTTDSFVVRPLFFPGGDIGQLAVHGTVNDLAVGGAVPLYLSAAFILEEGLPMETLARILASMRAACNEAGVGIVTGDTKVVDRGKGDQIYITTTGVGWVPPGVSLSIANARPGDRVLVSGTLGDHGIAILSVREGLEFDTELRSDTAALGGLTQSMLEQCPAIRCMRDPTRGGLSSTLNEIAAASAVGIRIQQAAIPIRPEVRAACELLGLDPLYVANEGKLVAVAPPDEADALLEVIRRSPLGREAAIIGEIVDDHCGIVVQQTLVGGERVVSMLAGEQLPRIC